MSPLFADVAPEVEEVVLRFFVAGQLGVDMRIAGQAASLPTPNRNRTRPAPRPRRASREL